MEQGVEIGPYASYGHDCKLIGCCVEGTLGDRVTVWRWAHVMRDAFVGDGTVIGQCAFVHSGATIGKNCRILNHACISEKGVIGDRVYIGPNVVFANAKLPQHDPARRVHLPIIVKDDAVVGANAVLMGGVTVGKGAVVGAGSVVTHDVPDGWTVKGVPAR